MKKTCFLLFIVLLLSGCNNFSSSNDSSESNNSTDSSKIEIDILGKFVCAADYFEAFIESPEYIPYITFEGDGICSLLIYYIGGKCIATGVYDIENEIIKVELDLRGTPVYGTDEGGFPYMDDKYVFEIISNNEIVIHGEFYAVMDGDAFVRADTCPESSTVNEVDEFGNRVSWMPYNSRFPLYAMLKSENIYLYGISDSANYRGMVLYQNGKGMYFDWPILTPCLVLPELYYFDYDGDGEKELIVILCVASDNEGARMDLHILKEKKDNLGHITYADNSLISENLEEWFSKRFTSKYSNDNKTIIVNFDGKDYNVKNDYVTFGSLKGIVFGDIVEFKFNDKQEIIAIISIGFDFENLESAYYFGEVEAKISFDGEKIYLSDYDFTID